MVTEFEMVSIVHAQANQELYHQASRCLHSMGQKEKISFEIYVNSTT
jgi:hypothetical protein